MALYVTSPTPNLLLIISKVADYRTLEGKEHKCMVSLVGNPEEDRLGT